MAAFQKSPGPIKILLVEDDAADAKFVELQIAESDLDFSLTVEQTLHSAIERFNLNQVDVVLLDLTLPDGHGIATFTNLRARAVDTPIIILSGDDDVDVAIAAVSEGAQDYLIKGKVDSDSLTRSIRYAIERSRRQHAEKELSAAGAIQRQLLPKFAPQVPGFDIGGRCESAAFVGGDYFDFFPMRDHRLCIAIADVSGHGVGPAVVISETRAILRTLAPISNNVGDIMTRANRVIASELVGGAFIAVFLACLDPVKKEFEFAGAGHPGFVLDQSGKIKRLLKTNDPPLGVERKHKYSSSPSLPLDDYEALFLYTDGLVECRGPNAVEFGKKRLFDTMPQVYGRTANEIISTIFETVKDYSGHGAFDDDMTAVFVRAQPLKLNVSPPKPSSEPTSLDKSYKRFEIQSVTGVTLLVLSDKSILDTQVCKELQREILDFTRAENPMRLLISFREVERLSSEMISSLIRVRSVLTKNKGSLRLCDLSPAIREVFTALNMDGPVFTIEDDVDAGVESF